MLPASNASSISLTNTPREPISPNGFVRSRSPAVVMGTSAISTPGRRSRRAASSACVSASLLPREPIRTSIVPKPEQVADDVGIDATVGSRCGRLLQPHRRKVQELVDDLRRQRLDRPPILLGESAQAALEPLQLAGANLLGPSAQRRDRGHDVERRLPCTKALRLLHHD